MSRLERVAKLIKAEISEILRKKVNDPRLGFLSITGVEVSADLEQAKVFVSILGKEADQKNSMRGLKSAASFIRLELGKRLQLFQTPKLMFVQDNSLERGSQMLSLMQGLKNDKAAK